MKVENRIEALEQELKILKNEIQSTLLEIREQVLNHYYPELRAEEPTRRSPKIREVAAKGEGQSRIAGQDSASSTQPKAKAMTVSPFSDFSIQDLEDDLEDEDFGDIHSSSQFDDELEAEIAEPDDRTPATTRLPAALPRTREVMLQHVKDVSKPKPRSNVREAQGKVVGRPGFAELAKWVSDSVTKVGKERARQAVETYAATTDALAPETQKSLLQLISLSSDVEPENPASNQEIMNLMISLDQLLSEA